MEPVQTGVLSENKETIVASNANATIFYVTDSLQGKIVQPHPFQRNTTGLFLPPQLHIFGLQKLVQRSSVICHICQAQGLFRPPHAIRIL